MSDSSAESAPKKKGGKMKMLLILLGAVGGLGGGGAFAGYYFGHSAAAKDGHEPVADLPKLVPVNAEDADRPAPPHGAPLEKSLYKASYYPIEAPFTSNLKDSDSFVQVSLGVSTYYDERVVDAVKTHEMALRSAVLLQLAEQDPMTLSTPQGKAALQRTLTDAMNRTLRERTGFGGIDNVYFTSLVVQ
jgi:flagellar FliL protein